jgi:DNA-binding CsgD family transcriptional regulator
MLIGRAAETAAIERLLTAAREGRSGVLVLRGEAGIGKSALLAHAAEQADGFTILRGVGVEVESELPYAALHQILRPVLGRLGLLPQPQGAALRAAFALSDETVGDRFRVSLAVLGLLADAAEERPVLCLVDDAQWLDGASTDALLFATRRLEAERIALLFAARDDERYPFRAEGLEDLRLAPLEQSAANALLRDHVGFDISAAVVDWLLESASGNPLALMELPHLLSREQLAGTEAVMSALPPITSVEGTYLGRVRSLQPETQTLLLVAAAEGSDDRATVQHASAALGLDPLQLGEAEAAGLIHVEPDRIAFRHPLVRSAVYRGAGFVERERVHRALADVLTTPAEADRRAWHRAAATVGHDGDVADELESTAERAASRSGYAAAAAALRRAAELSVDRKSEGRRLVAAGDAAWRSGNPDSASKLLAAAEPLVEDVRLRAEIDHIRGVIELRRGNLLDAGAVLMNAAERVAPVDPRKALEMLVDAGSVAGRSGDSARMAEIGRLIAALPRSGDEAEAVLSDLLMGVGGIIAGETASEAPRIVGAVARASAFDDPRILSWAATGASTVGDEASEAALLRRAVTVARTSGAVDDLTLILETIVSSGIVGGRLGVEAEAAEGLRLARDANLPNAASALLAGVAWLAALRGNDDECRRSAAEVTRSVRTSNLANANSTAEWAVALLDLSIGNPEAAVARLAALRQAPLGVVHPFFLVLFAPDAVEAAVRAGDRDEAWAGFAPLQGFVADGGPSWALAFGARCRALLAEDAATAEHVYEEALRAHADIPERVFDRARTELLYGEHLRRQRRRAESREHLRAALEAFDSLGAAPWAERARGELRATGETARKRDPGTLAQLTPQELQIARLVAEGRSNKEVAAQLFLSPRTIDYHLRKVFMKLGITSRAELIRDGVVADAQPAVA